MKYSYSIEFFLLFKIFPMATEFVIKLEQETMLTVNFREAPGKAIFFNLFISARNGNNVYEGKSLNNYGT